MVVGGGGVQAGMQDVFLRRNSMGMVLVHFSPHSGCAASTPQTSSPTAQRSGQMLLTSSSMAECIIRLLFT